MKFEDIRMTPGPGMPVPIRSAIEKYYRVVFCAVVKKYMVISFVDYYGRDSPHEKSRY